MGKRVDREEGRKVGRNEEGWEGRKVDENI